MEVSLNWCAVIRVYKKNTTTEEGHCLGPEYKVKSTENSSQTCCTKGEVQKWREDSSLWNLRGWSYCHVLCEMQGWAAKLPGAASLHATSQAATVTGTVLERSLAGAGILTPRHVVQDSTISKKAVTGT